MAPKPDLAPWSSEIESESDSGGVEVDLAGIDEATASAPARLRSATMTRAP